jgi:phage terminase large subunit-like protein
MVKFRQGFASMSPASKNFEKAVLDGRIVHDRNPIMAWNLQCTAIESDPAGNIKPSKKALAHSSRRIDGVVAAIMATGLYLNGDQEQTASDDGEVFVI